MFLYLDFFALLAPIPQNQNNRVSEDLQASSSKKRKISDIPACQIEISSNSFRSLDDSQVKVTPKRVNFPLNQEKSNNQSSSSKVQKYWFYDISNINIEGPISSLNFVFFFYQLIYN